MSVGTIAPGATDQGEARRVPCDVCGGEKTIDWEFLGEHTSVEEIPCPKCDTRGWIYNAEVFA